ncbi:MAG: hypothetical protein IPL74_13000 [Bacteroidetes bacterium]|nr:hypothetical protein [Bacteroidota bacterium]
MGHNNKLKRTLHIFLIFGVSVVIVSCKQEKFSLLGKWSGSPVENCPNQMFSKGVKTANYEFLPNGVCKISFEGSNGMESAAVNFPESQYNLTSDSLILTFSDNVSTRQAFKYEVKNENVIVLTRSYTLQTDPQSSCSSVTELTRTTKGLN